MSGHSHAKTVKRVKDANDAARGKVFSKLSRVISLAAKDGGDPESNSKLKQAIAEAKKFNLPKDNIEKAIKRGTGELKDGQTLEEVRYEALGPGGVAIIIEGITDNNNRSFGEIKQILQKNNAKLAQEGSLSWQFEQKGIITAINIKDKEELELKAIEAGADDIKWYKNEEDKEVAEIYTPTTDLETAKNTLEAQGVEIESSSLGFMAKNEVTLEEKDKASLEKLFEELDENDTVQDIYSNLKT